MSTYFTDVDVPNKLYHLDVDIPNTNETEGMPTNLRDANIPNKQQIHKTNIQRQVITVPINEVIK